MEFSEAEIVAWHESHSEDYQSEEQVIIEYVELDAALLPVGLPPEEDYLRDQFESQRHVLSALNSGRSHIF